MREDRYDGGGTGAGSPGISSVGNNGGNTNRGLRPLRRDEESKAKSKVIYNMLKSGTDKTYSRLIGGGTDDIGIAITDKFLGNKKKVKEHLNNKISNPLNDSNTNTSDNSMTQNKDLRLKLKARLRSGNATPQELAMYKRLQARRSSNGLIGSSVTSGVDVLGALGVKGLMRLSTGGGKRDVEIQHQLKSGNLDKRSKRLMRRATRLGNLEHEKQQAEDKGKGNLTKVGIHLKRAFDVVRSNKSLNKSAHYKY
jgi:hypothetical protein